jgi:hypothetical protein
MIKLKKKSITDEEIQKELNYWLKKKYRYQRLGLDDGVLECEAYISLYENRLLDCLDYLEELEEKKKEYYASFAGLIKTYNDIKEKEIMNKYTNSLMDMTKKEAMEAGQDTYKKFCDLEEKMVDWIGLREHKATILKVETLRELYEKMLEYYPEVKRK